MSPRLSAGAHVGTVSAITLPFSTGIEVVSGNWTVWPKYGVSVCERARAGHPAERAVALLEHG